jgi:hypothetical protein
MHCKPTRRFRAAARAWFVLIVAWASALSSSAADECELPDWLSSGIRATSQFEDFRITLDPPDYGNADAVRQHFTFSSAWGSMLRSEYAARSQGDCDLRIASNIFPDLRAFLVGYRSAKGRDDFFEAVCVSLLREIVHNWTPDEAAVANAVVDLTKSGKWAKGLALSASNNSFDFTENVLRSALARIYDEKSVMHALVSVDTASYRPLAAGSFIAWIGKQRRGRLGIVRLSICPIALPRAAWGPMPLYKKRVPLFPPSTTAPAGVITIPHGEAGTVLPAAFHHVVVIGDDPPAAASPAFFYAFSPYVRAAELKYCGKRIALDPGDNAIRSTPMSASIKCQFATILKYDYWMMLFCQDCGSAGAAEAVAKLVIDDPDLRAIKSSETDMKSKGPYLVSFTAGGK